MSERELVAIRRPSGKLSLIAREDYDPIKHTLWEEPTNAVQGEAQEVAQEVTPKRRGRQRRG